MNVYSFLLVKHELPFNFLKKNNSNLNNGNSSFSREGFFISSLFINIFLYKFFVLLFNKLINRNEFFFFYRISWYKCTNENRCFKNSTLTKIFAFRDFWQGSETFLNIKIKILLWKFLIFLLGYFLKSPSKLWHAAWSVEKRIFIYI